MLDQDFQPEAKERHPAIASASRPRRFPIIRPTSMRPAAIRKVAKPTAIAIATMFTFKKASETPTVIASRLVPMAVAISTPIDRPTGPHLRTSRLPRKPSGCRRPRAAQRRSLIADGTHRSACRRCHQRFRRRAVLNPRHHGEDFATRNAPVDGVTVLFDTGQGRFVERQKGQENPGLVPTVRETSNFFAAISPLKSKA